MSRLDGSDTLLSKWVYGYDGSGNLKTAEYQNGSAVKQLNWVFTWNPRSQMTSATKYNASDVFQGKVEYHYCLACDGALSERIEYHPTTQGTIVNWKSYEYDGLNVLRVDEVCDDDLSGLIEDDEVTWRTVEVNTQKPGSLGALIGKRVYVYSDAADSSPNSSNDYTYTYDAVGNVQVVYRASGSIGQEAYFFTQDAFGNELSSCATSDAYKTNLFGGSTWASARTAGITEHQTGKIQSAFSGLYYFHARWYDPLVGRFVGRDPVKQCLHFLPHLYAITENLPTRYVDPKGLAKALPERIKQGCCSFGEYQAVVHSTRKACIRLMGMVPNPPGNRKLFECMLEECEEGEIECSHDCLDHQCGSFMPAKAKCPTIGEKQEYKWIKVCPSNTKNPGATVLHEWGHRCGCTEDRSEECTGVPPEEDDDYRDGGPCGWLPWHCNSGFRLFE